MLIRLATGLLAIVTFRRRAGPLTGPAKILDGDTIVVAGELVRLHGLDAPELDQTFWWRGERIACGMMAMAALEALTAGIQVRCQAVERDPHGRLVAKIFGPDGIDIGRRLVLAGWALAYRQNSTDYVDAEAEARKARRGLWRGTFAKPWEWRSIAPRVQASSTNAPRTGSAPFAPKW
jgi:endonuclease YncB( thermonuclease family)